MIDLEPADIEKAARAYFVEGLKRVNDHVWAARLDRDLDREFEASDSLEAARQLKDALANHSFDVAVWADAAEALQKAGLPVDKLSLDSRDQIREAIVRAQIEHHRIYAARLKGDEAGGNPADPLFNGLQSTATAPELAGAQPEPTGLTVKAAVDLYCSRKEKEWVQKTCLDNRRVLDILVHCVRGDRPVSSLAKSDVANFREHLQNLPAHAAKRKLNVKQDAGAVGSLPPVGQLLSSKTVQKYYFMMRAFLVWLRNEELIAETPGGTLGVPKPSLKAQQDARHPFNAQQLQQLFSSPAFVGAKSAARRSVTGTVVKRDALFWIPLVGLFTGMRLGEIVQLENCDVGEIDDIEFIFVWAGENGQKTIKTLQRKRKIPVHQELIRCGLLDYVAGRRKADPKGRLFPEVRLGTMGDPSHAFSKQFGRYLDAIGLKSRKLTFHSLRHTFKDALMAAEVPEATAKALMGHSDASVHAIYGSGITIGHLNSAIQKVKYPLNFELLRQNASVKVAP